MFIVTVREEKIPVESYGVIWKCYVHLYSLSSGTVVSLARNLKECLFTGQIRLLAYCTSNWPVLISESCLFEAGWRQCSHTGPGNEKFFIFLD